MRTFEPAPQARDYGLSDADICREIAKDVAYGRYYDTGRMTPGSVITVAAAVTALMIASLSRVNWQIDIVIAGTIWAFAIGRLANVIIRKRLRHCSAYDAFQHATALYRLARDESADDLATPPPVGSFDRRASRADARSAPRFAAPALASCE
jgi:hypothetical protein